MPRPIVYYGNFLLSGTLSGTNTQTTSGTGQVRRVADYDLSLPYKVVSGNPEGIVEGHVDVTLPSTAVQPDAFIMVSGTSLSGFQAVVASEDGGGSNRNVYDTRTLSGTSPYVVEFAASGNTHFRYELSGTTSGLGNPTLHELVFATKYQLPRSPSVGVDRTRVRRFDRLDIPGGAPFTFRQGGSLRRRAYTFILTSGQEDGLESFVQAVDGGEPFWLVDDDGDSYWAELLGSDLALADDAGVFTVSLVFQEVRP